MRYNLLDNTGLYVSELCLGAMTSGGGSNLLDKRLGLPTLNSISWSVTALIAVAVNVLVEGTVLSRLFHTKMSKRNFGWLLIANVLSVGLAFAAVLLGRPLK